MNCSQIVGSSLLRNEDVATAKVHIQLDSFVKAGTEDPSQALVHFRLSLGHAKKVLQLLIIARSIDRIRMS